MKPVASSYRLARRIALFLGIAVVLACGGGGGLFPNDTSSLFGMAGRMGVIWGQPTSAFVQVSYDGIVYSGFLPAGHTVQQHQAVAGFTPGTTVFPNASLHGSNVDVTITNLLTQEGGLLPNVGLAQVGPNVALTGGIVLPEGRYEMEIEAHIEWYSGLLRTEKLIVEFDVFSNGFTNIPIDLRGTLPRHGQSLSGFTVTGQIPPNQGQGDATMEIKPVGGASVSSSTTKALGATTWTWTFDDTLSVPIEGLEYIDIRVNF